MDELEIAAKLVASRIKTEFPFVLNNLEQFFERLESWRRERDDISDQQTKVKFDIFRKAYPGVKRGLDVEYANFMKKYPKEFMHVVNQLLPALQKEMAYHKACKLEGKFCPEYKHLQTWINSRSWETVFPEVATKQAVAPAPETRRYAR